MGDILAPAALPVTRSARVDFSGGDLTSDGGLLLLGELAAALGVREALASELPSHPLRDFDDADVAFQKAMMVACGYAADDDEGALRPDPAFAQVVGRMASQETMSRRLSAMGPSDVAALRRALASVASRAAAAGPAEDVVVDVDTTLLATFGSQEGASWNFHYGAAGYHPIVAVDTMRRDVVGLELRPGSQYCSRGAGEFVARVLREAAERHPGAVPALRADAGFSAPEVYGACEDAGAMYAVRLKSNATLRGLSASAEDALEPGVARELCGEFMYRAGSWDRERRVCFAATMREGELLPQVAYVVTNMRARPRLVVEFYRKRGDMEQVIGELKGFLRGCPPRRSMAANEFCCLLGALAYSLVNWLRRLCLPPCGAPERAATVVRDFVKVAARRVRHAGSTLFRLCSSYPRRERLLAGLAACGEVARAG